jgi:hypothetical protein
VFDTHAVHQGLRTGHISRKHFPRPRKFLPHQSILVQTTARLTVPPGDISGHQPQHLAGTHLVDGIEQSQPVHKGEPAISQLVPGSRRDVPGGRVVAPANYHVLVEDVAPPHFLQELRRLVHQLALADWAFEDVREHYAEPGRFYHTLDHVQNMMETVGSLGLYTRNLNAVRLATWLHDVICDSKASDNEERSAEYAERLCEKLSIPDGRLVASLILKTKTHDAEDDPDALDKRITALTFMPDAAMLLVGGTGPIYRVRLSEGQKEGELAGHKVVVACLRLTPDGQLLASTGGDATLRLWSTKDWSEVKKVDLRASGVFQMAIAPTGDVVSVGANHLIQTFSLKDGKLVDRIELPVKGVYGLAISPDGRYLANAAADGKVRVWQRC